MRMLMNYRQTGKRAQQRDEESWMIIPMCIEEAKFVYLCSVGNKREYGGLCSILCIYELGKMCHSDLAVCLFLSLR